MNKKLLIGIVVAVAVVMAVAQAMVVLFVIKMNGTPKENYVEDAQCGLNMKMVYVEGGSYKFGRSEYSQEVSLDDFWIGECEVTQAQWSAIMGSSIRYQSEKSNMQTGEARPLRGEGSNYPMYYVSYYEAKEFCRKLSQLTGRKYDLPTEAQWEFAARGGNNNDEYAYSGSNSLAEVAWYDMNSKTSSHPVKSLRPNKLGIYDMSGNLREWCSDWYSEGVYLDKKNPKGPEYGTIRVVRGGSWRWDGCECFVWWRDFDRRDKEQNPAYSTSYIGFRVVCLD